MKAATSSINNEIIQLFFVKHCHRTLIVVGVKCQCMHSWIQLMREDSWQTSTVKTRWSDRSVIGSKEILLHRSIIHCCGANSAWPTTLTRKHFALECFASNWLDISVEIQQPTERCLSWNEWKKRYFQSSSFVGIFYLWHLPHHHFSAERSIVP